MSRPILQQWRRLRAFSYALLLILINQSAVWGWGEAGHAIVAQIADDRLSVNAKREVRKLLGDLSMADVSSWADRIRGSQPQTRTWHYVNITIEEASDGRYDPAKHNVNGACIVERIKAFEKTLADSKAPKEDRVIALKWLIHLLGDVHQPLHTVDRLYNGQMDRGGNGVVVRYPSIKAQQKLHAVWDSLIIKNELLKAAKAKDVAERLGDKLKTMHEQIGEWRKNDGPEKWASEGHLVAAKVVYAGIPTKTDKAPVLDEKYVEKAIPVIEEQLMKGGIRLADILNGAFP